MIKIEWAQWTLYFFLYAFAGWIWGSAYVSVLSQQWVNRGFLHGPFIPIYGFGALLILMMTYEQLPDLWHTFAALAEWRSYQNTLWDFRALFF